MHQSAIVLVRCVPGSSLLLPPYWKARRPWERGCILGDLRRGWEETKNGGRNRRRRRQWRGEKMYLPMIRLWDMLHQFQPMKLSLNLSSWQHHDSWCFICDRLTFLYARCKMENCDVKFGDACRTLSTRNVTAKAIVTLFGLHATASIWLKDMTDTCSQMKMAYFPCLTPSPPRKVTQESASNVLITIQACQKKAQTTICNDRHIDFR